MNENDELVSKPEDSETKPVDKAAAIESKGKDDAPEDKPVTGKEFKENINIVLNEWLTQVDKKIDEKLSHKINEVSREMTTALQSHKVAIEELQKVAQSSLVPANNVQPQRMRLEDLIETVDKISQIPVIKDKLGGGSDPVDQELRALGDTLAIGIKRGAVKEIQKAIVKQYRKGDLFAEEVQDVVAKVAEHGPGV